MTRIARLQRVLEQQDLPALFVTDPVNVSYLTGFTGDESAVLVSQDKAWFLTDARFTIQAEEEVQGATIITQTKGLAQAAADCLAAKTTVGFEADVLTYAAVQDLPLTVAWQPTTNLVAALREVKDEDEIALIKEAIAIAEAGYQHVLATIHPGMTELAVATELDFFMRAKGASGVSFETIVASGPRSAEPHGAATTRVIEAGDVVTLDWGARYHGYVSDLTRTFVVGKPDSSELAAVYDVVFACNQAVQQMIKPGVTGQAIDAFAHDFIDQAGYGAYFGHGTGHGIGRSIHEGPGAWRPYHDVPQASGNVETVEPGIYLPGAFGVRIEDDVLVTQTGMVALSQPAPATLLVV